MNCCLAAPFYKLMLFFVFYFLFDCNFNQMQPYEEYLRISHQWSCSMHSGTQLVLKSVLWQLSWALGIRLEFDSKIWSHRAWSWKCLRENHTVLDCENCIWISRPRCLSEWTNSICDLSAGGKFCLRLEYLQDSWSEFCLKCTVYCSVGQIPHRQNKYE